MEKRISDPVAHRIIEPEAGSDANYRIEILIGRATQQSGGEFACKLQILGIGEWNAKPHKMSGNDSYQAVEIVMRFAEMRIRDSELGSVVDSFWIKNACSLGAEA